MKGIKFLQSCAAPQPGGGRDLLLLSSLICWGTPSSLLQWGVLGLV